MSLVLIGMAFIDSVSFMCLGLEMESELLAKIAPAGDMYPGCF